MPTVGQVETQIQRVEGFRVALLPSPSRASTRKLNGNKTGIPKYKWEKGAPGSWSVQEWVEKRFNAQYPGLGVRVFATDGSSINYRQTKLHALRQSAST